MIALLALPYRAPKMLSHISRYLAVYYASSITAGWTLVSDVTHGIDACFASYPTGSVISYDSVRYEPIAMRSRARQGLS
jgi:hypothetical protein